MLTTPENTLFDHQARSKFFRQGKGGTLVVCSGPELGKVFEVQETPVVIGSGEEADIRLKDPMISRRHIRVTPRGGTLEIRDLDSTNGSFHHEAKFNELTLSYGSDFRIGNTKLKYIPIHESLEPPPIVAQRFGSMLGKTTAMREVYEMVGQVARENATVLIVGETGTGKELVAREIHEHSNRSKGPFVVFDCAATPRELIESILFGHIRGAFTGATGDRQGAFEEADGGTIFLDEIGELGLELQPALLRVLESRTVARVGSSQRNKIDVRVITATHRQLGEQVRAAKFREDLFYRLAVVCISVPSLRERREDIPLLVEHFMNQFSPSKKHIDPAVLQRFQEHPWPGNVRELRNAVERVCIFGESVDPLEAATTTHLNEPNAGVISLPPTVDYKEAKRTIVEDFEKAFVIGLLRRHNNNFTSAAKEANMDRKYLRDLAKKYNIA